MQNIHTDYNILDVSENTTTIKGMSKIKYINWILIFILNVI